MHEHNEEGRTLQMESISPMDLDPPEPLEFWTIEDFDDLLAGA